MSRRGAAPGTGVSIVWCVWDSWAEAEGFCELAVFFGVGDSSDAPEAEQAAVEHARGLQGGEPTPRFLVARMHLVGGNAV